MPRFLSQIPFVGALARGIAHARSEWIYRRAIVVLVAGTGDVREVALAPELRGRLWWAEGEDAQPAAEPLDDPDDGRAVLDLPAAKALNGARGGRLVAIGVEGRLVGWGFLSHPPQPFPIGEAPGAAVARARGEAVISQCYVRTRDRGQRLYQALLVQMVHRALAAGAPRVWIYVRAENAPSVTAIERVGFRRAGTWFADRWLWRSTLRWEAVPGAQSAGSTSTKLS